MNFIFFIPVLVVVASNVLYHNVAKLTPQNANAFLSLVVTYFVGTIVSLVLYLIFGNGGNIVQELRKLNWASYIMGLAIVGLEAGYIYMYRIGWELSKGSLVCGALLAVILLIMGCVFYKEVLDIKKIAGAILCIGGLILINWK